jgi:hypothetical protein
VENAESVSTPGSRYPGKVDSQFVLEFSICGYAVIRPLTRSSKLSDAFVATAV